MGDLRLRAAVFVNFVAMRRAMTKQGLLLPHENKICELQDVLLLACNFQCLIDLTSSVFLFLSSMAGSMLFVSFSVERLGNGSIIERCSSLEGATQGPPS